MAVMKEGDIIAGTYRVEGLLGRGSMAVVFVATHMVLGQKVAIKALLPEMMRHPTIIERFAREARAVAKLKSQHVTRILDVGALPGSPGTPYLVMEYLEGADLSALVDKRGPLPIHIVADLGIQACEAIAEAHALGIVHRDLKPANLFLARRANGPPILKVLDFGVAKILDRQEESTQLTQAYEVVGSPHYMSPEQVTCAKDIDARADVWAMGVVLYRLLTALPAFDAGSFAELRMGILQDTPKSLRAIRPDIPAGLEAAVMKCLVKNRGGRFESINKLMAALQPYLVPVPEASHPRVSLPPPEPAGPSSDDSPTVVMVPRGSIPAPAPAHARAPTQPPAPLSIVAAVVAPPRRTPVLVIAGGLVLLSMFLVTGTVIARKLTSALTSAVTHARASASPVPPPPVDPPVDPPPDPSR